jgi:hypothetical protein
VAAEAAEKKSRLAKALNDARKSVLGGLREQETMAFAFARAREAMEKACSMASEELGNETRLQ